MTANVALPDKVVCVTGVSSGLGRALAQAFTAAGAAVVGTARREEAGRDLERELTAAGGRMMFVAGDIADVGHCERLVDQAVERFGRVDVLVNNAAIRPDPPLVAIHDTELEQWDAVYDVNVRAAFFLTKFALAPMRAAGRGHILNIASYTAMQATAGMALYATSKAALVHLSRATAVEYAADGIRANAIILGGTDTGQGARTAAAHADFLHARPLATGGVTEVTVSLPAGPTGGMDPAEVARALVLLCVDDAAPITGAAIAIDGGVSAGLQTSQWTHTMLLNAGRRT